MYKITSQNRQTSRRVSTRIKHVDSKETLCQSANHRRKVYYWDIKRCVDFNLNLPSRIPPGIPPWVLLEIESFGGVEAWVKKNYHWQKRLQDKTDNLIEFRVPPVPNANIVEERKAWGVIRKKV